METLDYVKCGVLYLLAQALTILWVQVPHYKKMWVKVGERFSFKKFRQAEITMWVGVIIFGVIALMVADLLPELFKWKINYTTMPLVFLFLGAFGVTVAAHKWGKTQRFLDNIVDKKITDKTPITDLHNETKPNN